jgi:NAD(P)-dependent dehydrogenase (short-subunit alcohol dehydrogenase family)
MSDTKTCLIVGASRGLGLGLCQHLLARGWRVIATTRGASPDLEALAAGASGRLVLERVDITQPDQISALAARLKGESLKILMVNAGVGERNVREFATAFRTIMETNVLGAITAVKSLSPLVETGGVVAAMSSALGSLGANTTGGWEPYRASKAALNQSLLSFAAENAAKGWAVTAVHPGWVRTDMGGPEAPLDVETSTAGVATVLEARVGQGGCVFQDYTGATLPW